MPVSIVSYRLTVFPAKKIKMEGEVNKYFNLNKEFNINGYFNG